MSLRDASHHFETTDYQGRDSWNLCISVNVADDVMESHSAEPFSLSILGSVPLEAMKFMSMLVLLGFRRVSALSLHHSRGTSGAGFSFMRCAFDPEGCIG